MKINFRKWFCKNLGKFNFFYKTCDCIRYEKDTLICESTSLRANEWCSKIIKKKFKPSNEPTICATHVAPPLPIPKWKICSATGLEATRWCPKTEIIYTEPKIACRRHLPPDPKKPTDFVMFAVDVACRNDFVDDDVMNMSMRLGKAGVGYARIFLGWDPNNGLRESPFLPAGSSAMPVDCYKINPDWIKLMQRFQRSLAKCGMGILMDFFGQQVCRPSYNWAWFARGHNVNDIDSCYDVKLTSMAFWKWYIKEVFNIIGREGNLMHLGNEQQAPGDHGSNETSNVNVISEWARNWAVPLAFYVRDELKIKMPIVCTGGNYRGTGHKISNRLIEDNGWPEDQIVNDLHGLTMYETFEKWYTPGPERKYSVRKYYSISDDGASFSPDNTPALEKRGICSNRVDGSIKCSCNQFWRIDTIKKIRKLLGDHIRFIEWMPQEYKGYRNPATKEWYKLGDLDQEISIDVYWKCAEALWGIDIRREL